MIERRKLYIKPDFMTYKTSLSDPHQADFKQGIQGDFKDNNININNIKDNTDYMRKIDGGKSYRGPRVSDQLQAMLDKI